MYFDKPQAMPHMQKIRTKTKGRYLRPFLLFGLSGFGQSVCGRVFSSALPTALRQSPSILTSPGFGPVIRFLLLGAIR